MSWRSIHFHDKDPWTGVVKETVWKWMMNDKHRSLVCIKSPDGEITIPDHNLYLRMPRDVKDYIETVILKRPKKLSPEKIIKHTSADTINFGVLIRDLYKKSPLGYSDIAGVFDSLKIDVSLSPEIFKVLAELDMAEYDLKSWEWTIKDPQELYK